MFNLSTFLKPKKSPTAGMMNPVVSSRAISPTPTPKIDYASVIKRGFENWGNPPAATLSGEFAAQVPKYKVFRDNPYLLPAMSILETSGGAKQKFKHNLLNWGIVPQQKGMFDPANPQEVINKAASGIGERMSYYDNFRRTGNLDDLSNVYAPLGENPGTGGPTTQTI